MKKKRLIILFWDLGIGGIQKRIRDITIEISRNKKTWAVYILLRRKKSESFSERISPLKNVHILTYPFESSRFKPPLGFIWWVLYMYIKLKPDVVLTFLPPLSFVTILISRVIFWIKAKIVINDGVIISTYLHLRRQGWLGIFIRRFYPYANSIIVPTQACKKDLEDHYSLNPEQIRVIPNWTLIKPLMLTGKYLYDLLYIGRLDREKNVLSLITVTKLVKQTFPYVRFLLVGSGSLRDSLLKEIQANNLSENLTISGFDSAVTKYFRKSKIFILPTLNEGMPNVVLEAAMCRIPSIISSYPGSSEVVKDNKTGYVVATPHEMAIKIVHLLKNSKKRKMMGINAQKLTKKYAAYDAQEDFIEAVLS